MWAPHRVETPDITPRRKRKFPISHSGATEIRPVMFGRKRQK